MSWGVIAPVLVLALTVAPALADDNEAKERAGELAARSAKHYKRGEFEAAATLLRDAYATYPEPNLLYNLARALEGLGDRSGAIDAYERYLASGKRIEDRGGIERRVATLKAELEQQRRAAAERSRAPPPAPPVVQPPIAAPLEAEPPPAPAREPRRFRKLPWITIASGVTIAAVGGVMGWRAKVNEDRAQDAMSGVAAQSFHDRARRDALAANILFGVGGAVVIAGVVILW